MAPKVNTIFSFKIIRLSLTIKSTEMGWRNDSAVKSASFLPRTQIRFPAPTLWHTTISNASSRESDAFFWSLLESGTYVLHKHTCRLTLIYIKIKCKNKRYRKLEFEMCFPKVTNITMQLLQVNDNFYVRKK